MVPLCSRTGFIRLVIKGRWRLFWMNRRYGRTKHETSIKWMEASWFSSSKNVHPTQFAVKVMFIVAYDIDGVILHHTVSPRQRVNADYYCMFLQHHLRSMLRRKRRHLVVQNPIILHGNAKSHTAAAAAAVTDLLRCCQWEILVHPPHSPDMSPCDYDFFTKVKEPLLGTRYNTRDKLILAIGRSIQNIKKDGSADGVRCLPNDCYCFVVFVI